MDKDNFILSAVASIKRDLTPKASNALSLKESFERDGFRLEWDSSRHEWDVFAD